MNKHKQDGFHLSFVAIALFVLFAIGVVGYTVIRRSHKSETVRWKFEEKTQQWTVSQGKAPSCPQPLKFQYSPVDITRASSIGWSGTYRGNSYKVHGGFGLVQSETVVMPMDGTLTNINRYYEGNPQELQYLVSFENDCGIMFYFDHLNKLSPQLEEIAKTLPEPKLNDTRSTPDSVPRIQLHAGEQIATETGAHLRNQYGIDFGVVDYRQRNKISSNPEWTKLHQQYQATEWYGACWLDILPDKDVTRAKQLAHVQINTNFTVKQVSDYCPDADYTTLEANGGIPTDRY